MSHHTLCCQLPALVMQVLDLQYRALHTCYSSANVPTAQHLFEQSARTPQQSWVLVVLYTQVNQPLLRGLLHLKSRFHISGLNWLLRVCHRRRAGHWQGICTCPR